MPLELNTGFEKSLAEYAHSPFNGTRKGDHQLTRIRARGVHRKCIRGIILQSASPEFLPADDRSGIKMTATTNQFRV